jgi:hypothetical protein
MYVCMYIHTYQGRATDNLNQRAKIIPSYHFRFGVSLQRYDSHSNQMFFFTDLHPFVMIVAVVPRHVGLRKGEVDIGFSFE